MSDHEAAQARLDAVLRIGLPLARNTTVGAIALARSAELIDPAWIPERWRPDLVPLLSAATRQRPAALSRRAVESILRDAWGGRGPGDEVEELSEQPVRVTSIGQVHHGVRAGAEVAVKILCPGLATAVRQDLALAEMLGTPLGIRLPRESILAACDLEQEAARLRRLHRALGPAGDVVVPAPVTELCRENVLVSGWLAPAGDGAPVDADAAAAAVLGFVIGGIREGLVDGDLSGEGVLALDAGRLGLLDCAALVQVPDAVGVAQACLAALEAFAAGEFPTLAEVLGPLGGAEASRLDVAAVSDVIARAESTPDLLWSELSVLVSRLGVGAGVLIAVAQLILLIARPGATGYWREQITVALSEGWSRA